MTTYQEIHPIESETYFVAQDDGCLVVSSGQKGKLTDDSPRVWISQSMAHWIVSNFLISENTCADD